MSLLLALVAPQTPPPITGTISAVIPVPTMVATGTVVNPEAPARPLIEVSLGKYRPQWQKDREQAEKDEARQLAQKQSVAKIVRRLDTQGQAADTVAVALLDVDIELNQRVVADVTKLLAARAADARQAKRWADKLIAAAQAKAAILQDDEEVMQLIMMLDEVNG
jgi:hypothetical protein